MKNLLAFFGILVMLFVGGIAIVPRASALFAVPPSLRWSSAATWRTLGQSPPKQRSDITIPAGQTVLLDTLPPPLARLTINGTLIVPDTMDGRLQVESIEVNGTFQIGSQSAPFQHRFTLHLGGASAGSVAVQNGGRLEWFGKEPGSSWLHLAATAPLGAQTVTLENAAPDWKTGDKIVLASTDFDAHQAEERTITAVKGSAIILDAPLIYTHWGHNEDGVDERGEVALLTRHIVVEGGEKGGCVMMMAQSTAHLSAVEFRQLGVRGRKGHYPVHFHRVGDASQSLVRGCSIHHCFNRSLTIHGTNRLRVFDNVSYDTIGHAYFLEDGDETQNELVHNLGLLTRAARPDEAVLPSDTTPATFWITNPNNVFFDNVAAGSDFHGFWVSLPKHPTGLAQSRENDRAFWPRHTPLGVFAHNTAHSNAHDGLFVDNGPNAPGETETPNYQPRENSRPTLAGKNPSKPVIAVFEAFTAYKNRRRGAWLRGDHLRLVHAALADNSIGATLAASESFVQDSRIVGETANVGTAQPGERTGVGGRTLPKPQEPETPLCGFEFYDGLVGVQNTTFVHFHSVPNRPAGALSCLRYSPFYINPRNFVETVRFVDANPVILPSKGEPGNPALSGDGYRSFVFQDKDGSLTGSAGSAVAVCNPLLQNEACRFNADWNASVCSSRYGHLFVDNKDAVPLPIGPVAFSRDGVPVSAPSHRAFGSPPATGKPATSFQTNVLARETYHVAFAKQSPNNYRLALRDCQPGDWIIATVDIPSTENITVRDAKGTQQSLPEVATLAALRQANASAIFRDHSEGKIYVKLTTNATRRAREPLSWFRVCSRRFWLPDKSKIVYRPGTAIV